MNRRHPIRLRVWHRSAVLPSRQSGWWERYVWQWECQICGKRNHPQNWHFQPSYVQMLGNSHARRSHGF